MDLFLYIKPSRTFLQNGVPVSNTVLPRISSKRAGKVFLVEIKNKILLQTLKIL